MQIQKDSWHYQIVRSNSRNETEVPTNMCTYMRRLLWGITTNAMFFAWLAVVVSIIAPFILCPPIAGLNLLFGFLPASWVVFNNKEIPLFMFCAIVGTAIYIVGAAYLCYIALNGALNRYRNSDFYRVRRAKKIGMENLPPKQPSVFALWLKDIHDKTCSPLEFVDTTPATE